MPRNLSWPIFITISAIFAGIFASSNSGGALRPILLFWFMLICPGMAMIRLLHLRDRLAELVLAIALSLVINTLLAEFMVLAGFWSPSAGLVALILISLVGAALQVKEASQNTLSTE